MPGGSEMREKFHVTRLSSDSQTYEEKKVEEEDWNKGKHEWRETLLRKPKIHIERREDILPDQGTCQQEEYHDDVESLGKQEEADKGDVEPQVVDGEAEHVEEQQPRQSDKAWHRPNH